MKKFKWKLPLPDKIKCESWNLLFDLLRKRTKKKICNCGIKPNEHTHLKDGVVRFRRPPNRIYYSVNPKGQHK